MQCLQRKIYAGSVMLVKHQSDRKSEKGKTRGKRENPTPLAVANYNEKLAEQRLRLQIAANFGPEDYHATLTYQGDPPSREDAKKELSNYLDRLRRICNRNGTELKYIYVTEWRNKRIHHHIILSGVSAKDAMKKWKRGHCRFTYLDASGDYKGLAAYLIKETKVNIREGLEGKRYQSSRNLKQPVVKEKVIKKWKPERTPKEYKHYALMDWENVVNPITGTLSQWAYYLRI